jgi:death on curing protein
VDVKYLDIDEVLRLHLLEVGDGVGLRDRNLLEAAVERPRQSAFGEDAYPTLESKAGALLDSLARNHPFLDGNKRIAVLASFVFLEINGFEVETTNDEVVETVLALIVREIDFDDLVVRIKSWMRPRADD